MPKLLLKGKSIGDIKGVLFDKDGTLSNSEENLIELAKLRIEKTISAYKGFQSESKQISNFENLLCSAYGLSKNTLSPNGCIAIGSRQQNLISTATILCLVLEDWSKAIELANKIFREVDDIHQMSSHKPKPKIPLPGVDKVLKRLKEAKVKCAVISNDSTIGIETFLNTHNLTNNFSGTWSADNFPAKPNRGAVIGICNLIGLQPHECALIGDADSDLMMAKDAGISIILGYTAGWTTPPKLKLHQHLIHHWNDLSVVQNTRFSDNISLT